MKKRVLIVGGGFAGVQLARSLDGRLFDVLLIDRLNHHQFQPLFYQVATSQIEPSNIAFPFRSIFSASEHVQVRLAEAKEILPHSNGLVTDIGTFGYDYLVLANGCRTNFFGNDEAQRHALTLKTTYDAIAIRNHILLTFERILSTEGDERQALLNLVIVGAGPTGVELAGAFAEIKRDVLPKDFPGIDFSQFTIHLIEGGPHVLNAMSASARTAAYGYLHHMEVDLQMGTTVKSYDGQVVTLSNGASIRSSTVIWTAGVTGNKLPGLPDTAWTPTNRLMVNRNNLVDGTENIYAVGDIALMRTPLFERGHPQVANVAINQARLLARNLRNREKGRPQTDYEYRDLGSMATIGRNKAVVDLPFIRFKGLFAWVVWMFLHLMLILSVKNKLLIFINWAWAYVTKNSSLRLILRQR